MAPGVTGAPTHPHAQKPAREQSRSLIVRGWATSHLPGMHRYSMLPRDLGKVAEVGAGPWTQTYFALRARPDVRLRRAATLITTVPHHGVPR
jgi:hypothetical protein